MTSTSQPTPNDEWAQALRRRIQQRTTDDPATRNALETTLLQRAHWLSAQPVPDRRAMRAFLLIAADDRATVRTPAGRKELFQVVAGLYERFERWAAQNAQSDLKLEPEDERAFRAVLTIYADSPTDKLRLLSLLNERNFEPGLARYLILNTPFFQEVEAVIAERMRQDVAALRRLKLTAEGPKTLLPGFAMAEVYFHQTREATISLGVNGEGRAKRCLERILKKILPEAEKLLTSHVQILAQQLYRSVYPACCDGVPASIAEDINRIFHHPVLGPAFRQAALSSDEVQRRLTPLTLYGLMHASGCHVKPSISMYHEPEREDDPAGLAKLAWLGIRKLMTEANGKVAELAIRLSRHLPESLSWERCVAAEEVWRQRPELRPALITATTDLLGQEGVDNRRGFVPWRRAFIEGNENLMEIAWQALAANGNPNVSVLDLRDELAASINSGQMNLWETMERAIHRLTENDPRQRMVVGIWLLVMAAGEPCPRESFIRALRETLNGLPNEQVGPATRGYLERLSQWLDGMERRITNKKHEASPVEPPTHATYNDPYKPRRRPDMTLE